MQQDCEMLEYVLGGHHQFGEAARTLASTFGGFAESVSAPEQRLAEVGLKPREVEKLKKFERAALELCRSRVMNRPVLSSWNALLDYLAAAMARQRVEQFRVLYLDRKNVLIADEVMGTGTIDEAPVYPREIVKRALELDACAVILVHNHPSGDPTPSRADIEMTREVVEAARALRIAVHDHIVIGRSGHASFKAMGLL